LTFNAANNIRRLNKEEVGLLLKEVDGIVTADGDKAEAHIRDYLVQPDSWDRWVASKGAEIQCHSKVTLILESLWRSSGSAMAAERQVLRHLQKKGEQ